MVVTAGKEIFSIVQLGSSEELLRAMAAEEV
jgi:hypothetical protein